MILVSVGTEQFAFDRLMYWIEVLKDNDLLQGEEVVVQYGNSKLLPSGVKVYRLLKEEMFRELIQQARLVIAHCGEGTVLLLDTLELPYILVPRSKRFNEHVDDHQVELALALEEMNVPIAWCPGDLVRFIAAPSRVSISDLSDNSAASVCRSLHRRFSPQRLPLGQPD
jgi:UDP-N-acetylglucosamine transferase subunit ALG13